MGVITNPQVQRTNEPTTPADYEAAQPSQPTPPAEYRAAPPVTADGYPAHQLKNQTDALGFKYLNLGRVDRVENVTGFGPGGMEVTETAKWRAPIIGSIPLIGELFTIPITGDTRHVSYPCAVGDASMPVGSEAYRQQAIAEQNIPTPMNPGSGGGQGPTGQESVQAGGPSGEQIIGPAQARGQATYNQYVREGQRRYNDYVIDNNMPHLVLEPDGKNGALTQKAFASIAQHLHETVGGNLTGGNLTPNVLQYMREKFDESDARPAPKAKAAPAGGSGRAGAQAVEPGTRPDCPPAQAQGGTGNQGGAGAQGGTGNPVSAGADGGNVTAGGPKPELLRPFDHVTNEVAHKFPSNHSAIWNARKNGTLHDVPFTYGWPQDKVDQETVRNIGQLSPGDRARAESQVAEAYLKDLKDKKRETQQLDPKLAELRANIEKEEGVRKYEDKDKYFTAQPEAKKIFDSKPGLYTIDGAQYRTLDLKEAAYKDAKEYFDLLKASPVPNTSPAPGKKTEAETGKAKDGTAADPTQENDADKVSGRDKAKAVFSGLGGKIADLASFAWEHPIAVGGTALAIGTAPFWAPAAAVTGLGYGLAALGVGTAAYGLWGVGSGISKANDAKTAKEVLAAYEEQGAGAADIGLGAASWLGGMKMVNGVRAAKAATAAASTPLPASGAAGAEATGAAAVEASPGLPAQIWNVFRHPIETGKAAKNRMLDLAKRGVDRVRGRNQQPVPKNAGIDDQGPIVLDDAANVADDVADDAAQAAAKANKDAEFLNAWKNTPTDELQARVEARVTELKTSKGPGWLMTDEGKELQQLRMQLKVESKNPDAIADRAGKAHQSGVLRNLLGNTPPKN